MKEAYYYDKLNHDQVKCQLCPHHCIIANGKKGICRVRENRDGVLYSLNYGELSAIHIDKVEKKPLKAFMEGTKTLSIGSYGCNFHCDFCQNYSISMEIPHTVHLTPKEVIDSAIDTNIPSIAYTYNEPTIFYEFMYDCAILAKKSDLKNIVVTNGYISEKPLRDILPYINAFNVDLKGYDNHKYLDICGGQVDDIFRTIEIASQSAHVEVTMLIVPDINDDVLKMKDLFARLSKIDSNIVLHLSRYFPNYKRHEEPTDISLLYELEREALKYLNKVYLGNI